MDSAERRVDFTDVIPLRTLHESVVQPEEIDHLGHLNVRFYATRALRASKRLAVDLGLTPESLERLDSELFISDVFTRHYREQLAGASLIVRGGVLEADGSSLRFYHELVNTDRDEIGATFVHRVELRRLSTKVHVPLPEEVAKAAPQHYVVWPEHGQPRTIDLDAALIIPSLEILQERGLEIDREKTVREDQCDANGFLKPSHFMNLLWGGPPPTLEEAEKFLFRLDNGHLMGWATMESRALNLELPRPGTRVRGFGAEVDIGRKTSFRHQWLFDLDRKRLLFRFSMLNLAFDTTDRRSIVIPDHIRAKMDREYAPELK